MTAAALFAVPANRAGISRETLPTLDQTRRPARIRLNDVALTAEQCLHPASSAPIYWTRCCRSVPSPWPANRSAAPSRAGPDAGLHRRAQAVQPRHRQLPAIKHRCADLMLSIENSRSVAYYAACVAQEALAGEGDAQLAGELGEASAIAKSEASEAFMHCAGESIQLHGGVGFTWEYDPHLYFKRARASEQMLGSPSWHRERRPP